MNDARGPGNNVTFKPSGLAVARRSVPAADLAGARTLQHLAPAELLVPYGASYWRLHRSLGSERLPLVVDERPSVQTKVRLDWRTAAHQSGAGSAIGC